MPTKACTKCGEVKELDLFTKAKWMKDGYYPSCKSCKSADYRSRKALNPELHAKRQAEADRRYKANNPGKHSAMKKRWYDNNREAARATANAWVEKNRSKVQLYVRMSNARRRSNGGRINYKFAIDLIKLQSGKCACCMTEINVLYHIDHIIPIKLGGSNEKTNLQILCPSCNLSKKAKHPIDFMQSRGYLL